MAHRKPEEGKPVNHGHRSKGTTLYMVKRTKNRGLKTSLALMAVAGVHVAAYLFGTVYFSTHFVPGTTINGRNVSGQTEVEVADALNDDMLSYASVIEAGDFKLKLDAQSMGLTSNGEDCAHQAIQQMNPFEWPLNMVRPQAIVVADSVSFDEALLRDYIKAKVEEFNATAEGPHDATVAFDEGKKSYKVQPQSVGTRLNADAVADAAIKNISEHRNGAKLDDSVREQPARKKDDAALVDAVKKANEFLSREISLALGDDVVASVSRDLLAGWVRVGEDLQVTVDPVPVTEWVQNTLGDVARGSDDDYEYSLDTESTSSSLVDDIYQNSSKVIGVERYAVEKEKPVETPAADTAEAPSESWNKSLGRYVDVDLGSQYARLYDANGSVIWESSIVSGNSGLGRNTPVGTFSIYSKQTDTVLVGDDEDGDGQPDYRSHVSYWMPFLGGYGLHDATWRYDFGGDIYSYAGSHGCVNLPYDAAASLYSLTHVGETVVVHW